MNNPLTKYADASVSQDLVLFNYHEYLVSEYDPVRNPTNSDPNSQIHGNSDNDPSLVINHFPNTYAARNSGLYWRTRIIRIPRVYDQCAESYMVPQFSTYVPGHEPAALSKDSIEIYQEAGKYQGYAFGITSLTPLVPQWLSETEYLEVVNTINTLLFEATTPGSNTTWLESVADFLTGTLYSTFVTKYLWKSSFSHGMTKVNAYVDKVNVKLREKHVDLQIIPLMKSAVLSLDFQIPMNHSDSSHWQSKKGHEQRPSESTMSAPGEQDKESSRV